MEEEKEGTQGSGLVDKQALRRAKEIGESRHSGFDNIKLEHMSKVI